MIYVLVAFIFWFIGFGSALVGQSSIDKKSAKDGIIKLDGKYYKLTPFDKNDISNYYKGDLWKDD